MKNPASALRGQGRPRYSRPGGERYNPFSIFGTLQKVK
jgi:hypothetical protein